jgi:hypothetical protein
MAAALAFVLGSESEGETRETILPVGEISVTTGSIDKLVPVEHKPDSVIFDPRVMTVDEPYPFKFEGVVMVAVKRADGSLDFYTLPE